MRDLFSLFVRTSPAPKNLTGSIRPDFLKGQGAFSNYPGFPPKDPPALVIPDRTLSFCQPTDSFSAIGPGLDLRKTVGLDGYYNQCE